MSETTNGPRWSAEEVREPTGHALDEWIAETVVASLVDPAEFEARRLQALHWHPSVWQEVLDALPPTAPEPRGADMADAFASSPLAAKLLGVLKVPGGALRGGPACDCPACRAKRGEPAGRAEVAREARRAQIRDESLRLMERNPQLLPEDAVALVVRLEAAVARIGELGEPAA